MKFAPATFLSTAILAVLVSACGGSEAKTKADSAGESGVAVSGEQLYSENCVVCHGTDGKAGMTGATDLSTSVLSHENTIEVITKGRNGMRAFSGQFSKEEIDAIARHVESLRK